MKFTTIKSIVAAAIVTVGMTAVAKSTVTVDEVKTGEPWSKITVNYTLGGVDAKLEYKVAFDVTADGQTASVTNGVAKLKDGAATKVIDTATLFGKQVADPKAKVKVTLIAVKPLDGVQLWEGGPHFATCNVGASKPEEYGYYFWWGDTVGYTHDGWEWMPVKGGMASITFDGVTSPTDSTFGRDPAWLKSNDYIDDEANPVLNAAHDPARAYLGAPWRMMTKDELDQLVGKCYVVWTDNWNNTGVKGTIVKGKGDYADNSVFFPAAGYGTGSELHDAGSRGHFWSSTPDANPNLASELDFTSSSFSSFYYYRCYGFPVRPVCGSAE